MGLARQRSVPVRTRLRASFWASVGVFALLLVLDFTWRLMPHAEEDRALVGDDSGEGSPAAPGRRLISEVYPPDAVLVKPYYSDPNRWLVFLHCIGIGYMLLGLNTVCDVYFTGALEVMVEKWKIKPDVAGATFMAAGGSAPELFTSLIGATVESDVGFSTIVGSAVFNVLFVIGLCGYAAKEDMILTWWPLFRDCTYYICGLALLAGFSANEEIVLYESILLFVAYLVYCLLMYNNTKLEELVDSRLRKARKQVAPEQNEVTGQTSGASLAIQGQGATSFGRTEKEDNTKEDGAPETTPEVTPEVPAEGVNTNGSGEEHKDEDDDGDFMKRPEGFRDQLVWCMSLPIYVPLYYGTPQPSERWFLATFVISLVWIAGFSFLLVWWVEILGDIVFRGSESASIIMGFTILAAGTSIPDAVSSVAVARAGEGDMAVSSSIGSNIFDILVGLPVPWTIKILAGIGSGGHTTVRITSPYLFFYVVLLLLMVCLTICSIHFLGWKLNKMLGLCMAALYGLFLTCALLVEFLKPPWLKWGTA